MTLDLNLMLAVAGLIFGAGVGWAGAKASSASAKHHATEALRKADAAHVRLDKHSERLTRVEANALNHERELTQSVARIERSLTAVHERLDRFMGARPE